MAKTKSTGNVPNKVVTDEDRRVVAHIFKEVREQGRGFVLPKQVTLLAGNRHK